MVLAKWKLFPHFCYLPLFAFCWHQSLLIVSFSLLGHWTGRLVCYSSLFTSKLVCTKVVIADFLFLSYVCDHVRASLSANNVSATNGGPAQRNCCNMHIRNGHQCLWRSNFCSWFVIDREHYNKLQSAHKENEIWCKQNKHKPNNSLLIISP